MKKITLLIILTIITIGCGNINNKIDVKINEFFNKYNKLDDEVLMDIDKKMLEAEIDPEIKPIVKSAYKRQFKEMKYKIIEINEYKDYAKVKVKVTLYDYENTKKDAEKYIDNNIDEFMLNNEVDYIKEKKYIFEKLNKTNKRKNESIYLKLHKDNNKWKIDDLTNETLLKLQG